MWLYLNTLKTSTSFISNITLLLSELPVKTDFPYPKVSVKVWGKYPKPFPHILFKSSWIPKSNPPPKAGPKSIWFLIS